MFLTKFGDFSMNVWILAFCIFIEKGIKLWIFLSNLGCDGIVVSTFQPLPIIEKHKVLKNLIQADMVASTSLTLEVFRDC